MLEEFRAIAPDFAALVDDGSLRLSSHDEDDSTFGNSMSILMGVDFLIRICMDRGQLFAEISNGGQVWHRLEAVLEFVNSTYTQDWFGTPPQQVKLANALKNELSAVGKLFRSESALDQFLQFEAEMESRVAKGIFPNR